MAGKNATSCHQQGGNADYKKHTFHMFSFGEFVASVYG
jgi:hypothetical protein